MADLDTETAPNAATIYETFEPTWPGEPDRWVCLVRAGTAGRGRPVYMVSYGADDVSRERARRAARAWCAANGYRVAALRKGAHKPITPEARVWHRVAGLAAKAELRRLGARG